MVMMRIMNVVVEGFWLLLSKGANMLATDEANSQVWGGGRT
jgi:hypothetical protein